MSGEQSHSYGGQAVLEGVMIRGRDNVSVAVRRPDGTIAVMCEPLSQIFTGRLRRIPLIRGVVVLVETLALGMRALSYSANVGLEAEGQEIGKGSMIGMMVVSLAIAIGVFFLVPVVATTPLEGLMGNNVVSNLSEGVIRLALFLGYIVLIGTMNDIRRVFMYHGAEHMTVHAQERGDPLEPQAVRRYSTAHPRCGTAFLLTVMVVAIVVFVVIPREPFWWLIVSRVILIPVIAAASYELIRLSARYSGNPLVRVVTVPNLALQSLTTKQPDDDQIEVAITAMRRTLDADAGRNAADAAVEEEPAASDDP